MSQNKFRTSSLLIATSVVFSSHAFATPPRYNVTDITNWTPAQKATLPFFKHYSLLPTPNAPTDFHLASRTSSGFYAGSTWNVFTGPDQRGVLISGSTVSIIDSWGDFHWWRTTPPATATYRIANALDVNWSGTVAGWANIPGTSHVSQEGPDVHAMTYDTVRGKIDVLPDARYGYATCINNRGEIAGYAYGGPGPVVGGFRRAVDGTMTMLAAVPPGYSPTPLWINAEGVVIGMSVPGGWASPSDSTVVPLTKLFSMPLATVTDLNDAGWIVGTSEQWDHTEHYATLWEPNNNGGWSPRDLTDLINTSNILLDKAFAINNTGHIIAVGHLDGSETGPSGLYLLTPTNSNSNSCVPDIGMHPHDVIGCGVSTSLAVQVVNPTGATTYQWLKDGDPIPSSSNPFAITATLVIASISPTTEGVYECVVTNTCGSRTSNTANITATCSPTCDSIDFNNDTSVFDAVDIDAFLSVYGEGPCVPVSATCNDIDFNNDGSVFDPCDIDSFLLQFSEGPCTLCGQ